MSNINDKWTFSTLQLLRTTYPVWKEWWFALVWIYTYIWDIVSHQWINRSSIASNSDLLNWNPWSYYLDERNHTRVYNTYTSNTTLTALNRIVLVDCTSWNIIITLPTWVWFIPELEISKIDSTANKVIITPFAWETIWGETTQEIVWKHDNVTLIANWTDWIIT